ncbi:MAG: hypothetical protein J1F32_07115 [Erysipelotrichales bacterium]|nr:hypothetical protein [Erysipelotrichales bacterium]
MKKSIINYLHTYFIIGLFCISFGLLFLILSILGCIIFQTMKLVIISLLSLVPIICGIVILHKTIYKVTFYKDRIEFSKFSRVFRTFNIESVNVKEVQMFRGCVLAFIDEKSEFENGFYGIDSTKKNRNIIKNDLNLEILKE